MWPRDTEEEGHDLQEKEKRRYWKTLHINANVQLSSSLYLSETFAHIQYAICVSFYLLLSSFHQLTCLKTNYEVLSSLYL